MARSVALFGRRLAMCPALRTTIPRLLERGSLSGAVRPPKIQLHLAVHGILSDAERWTEERRPWPYFGCSLQQFSLSWRLAGDYHRARRGDQALANNFGEVGHGLNVINGGGADASAIVPHEGQVHESPSQAL